MADPYINDVALLLHCDGSNGSTTFTDSGPDDVAVTAVGDAQVSTAQSRFGGASAYFDGSGSYLSLANSPALTLGTVDFTIEFWLRPADTAFHVLLGGPQNSGGYLAIALNPTAYGQLYVARTGVEWTLQFNGHSIQPNVWSHVAITRASNTHRLFVDGVQVGSEIYIYNQDWVNNPNGIYIGYSAEGSAYSGYIDDLRITKGVARYTTAFTPPTAPFDGLGSTYTPLGASLSYTGYAPELIVPGGVTYTPLEAGLSYAGGTPTVNTPCIAPFSIIEVSPSVCTVGVVTPLTITGTGFYDSTQMELRDALATPGVALPDFTLVSTTEITGASELVSEPKTSYVYGYNDLVAITKSGFPGNQQSRPIGAIDASILYMVSASDGFLYCSYDCGTTWELRNASDITYSLLVCGGDGSRVVAMDYGGISTPPALYISVDFGASFSPIESDFPDLSDYGPLICQPPYEDFVFVVNQFNESVARVSNLGWYNFPPSYPWGEINTTTTNGMFYVDGSLYVVATSPEWVPNWPYAWIFVSSDLGVGWTSFADVSNFPGSYDIWDITGADDGSVFYVRTRDSAFGGNFLLFRKRTDDPAWVKLSDNASAFNFSSDGRLIVLNEGGVIYHSSDYGDTWAVRSPLAYVEPGHMFSSGGMELLFHGYNATTQRAFNYFIEANAPFEYIMQLHATLVYAGMVPTLSNVPAPTIDPCLDHAPFTTPNLTPQSE